MHLKIYCLSYKAVIQTIPFFFNTLNIKTPDCNIFKAEETNIVLSDCKVSYMKLLPTEEMSQFFGQNSIANLVAKH